MASLVDIHRHLHVPRRTSRHSAHHPPVRNSPVPRRNLGRPGISDAIPHPDDRAIWPPRHGLPGYPHLLPRRVVHYGRAIRPLHGTRGMGRIPTVGHHHTQRSSVHARARMATHHRQPAARHHHCAHDHGHHVVYVVVRALRGNRRHGDPRCSCVRVACHQRSSLVGTRNSDLPRRIGNPLHPVHRC